MLLIGFLHRGGIEPWSYAIAGDIVTQGNEFVRFTMDDVDFKTRTILGEVWENGTWVNKRTRFPDSIRNFELKKDFDHILDIVPYSLGPIVRKDDQLELFGKFPSISKYMPMSLTIDENSPIIDKIVEWEGALLKPARGRLGQGIIYIKQNGNKFEVNDDGEIQTLTKKALEKYLKFLFEPETGPYILQQFAAGTGPKGRYFNVRVIVSKSGDGDWYTCNFLMSLLAKTGSIIANRDVGAKNIDLDAFLKYKHGKNVKKIYDDLFEAAVKITRVLDDSADASAEEIALDMAIDNNGKVWLHEANWRGGMWLFEDDIGLYRHGGLNLQAIAHENRSGNNLDYIKSVDIAVDGRFGLQKHFKQKKQCNTSDGIVFGLELSRNTKQSISLTTKAITNALPILSVSTASSFRAAQRSARLAMESVDQQIQCVKKPYIISRGGMCVHDPKDRKGYVRWIRDELLKENYISKEDMDLGYSISPDFLNYTVRQNRRDLGVDCLDLFIVEGLEFSLVNKKNWKQEWEKVTLEMYRQIKLGRIAKWGFAFDVRSLFKRNACNPECLLSAVKNLNLVAPSAIFINIPNDYNLRHLKNVIAKLEKIDLQIVFCLPDKKLGKREWNEAHECVDEAYLNAIKEHAKKGHIVLTPAHRIDDIDQILSSITEGKDVDLAESNPWFYNLDGQKNSGYIDMSTKNLDVKLDEERIKKSLKALSKFASFDHRQLFRFFVDGRFHKKYQGWSGYEKNEPGSVPGNLKAYCHAFDNFDISRGLKSSYIRELHAHCMKNVLTKNPKSAPGDMRYLEAGFNIFAHYSTINSIAEIIDRHKGEGVPLFHTRGFEKIADEFTAQEVFDALQEKKRLKFRPWYPKLSIEEEEALTNPDNLEKFYEVKHNIQRQFAIRIDKIVNEYNVEISQSEDDEAKLIAISRVVRNLEMLHPFPDGNGRTLVAVLMNHLLLFHGFLPAILFDPNIDIELSVKEFAEEMKKGIENTKLLLEDPEATLYDYSILESSEREIKDFENLAKDLIVRIAPYADLATGLDDFKPNSLKTKNIYLTPVKIASISNGNWLNVNENTLATLRFESIQFEEVDSPNQLYFLRNVADLMDDARDKVFELINSLSKKGVIAIVTDDMEVARKSSLPALYVEDVDDALASCARTARREVNCKSIAVVGSSYQRDTKLNLARLFDNQAVVNVLDGSDHKTPNIMASLANLRLSDNLEVAGIDVALRPNPVSYRARRIEPNIVLMTDLVDEPNKENRAKSFEAYSAVVDGLKEGGLYILNSTTAHLDDLIDTIVDRKEVSIQTFGKSAEDQGQLITSQYDENKKIWNVEAQIFGKTVTYSLNTENPDMPLLSVGMLLAASNLGYDINMAAELL